jgi:hypothetical protein
LTTDQKLAHVRWYIAQANKSNNRESKLTYVMRASGALGAWYADMTINHDDFNTLNREIDVEFQLTLKESK